MILGVGIIAENYRESRNTYKLYLKLPCSMKYIYDFFREGYYEFRSSYY